MFEVFLIIAFFFWLLYKVGIWVFNALLDILPPHIAYNVRRVVKFFVALFIVLMVLSAMTGS